MLEKIKEVIKTGFSAFGLFMVDLIIYGLYPQNSFVSWFCFLLSIALVVVFCKGYKSIALGVSGIYFVIGLFVYGIDKIISGIVEFGSRLYQVGTIAVPYIVAIAVFYYFLGRIGKGGTKNRKYSVNKQKNLAEDDFYDESIKEDEDDLDIDGSCIDGYLFEGCNSNHPSWAIGYVNHDGYVFRKGSMTHNSHAVGYISGKLIYVTGSSYPVACIKGKNLFNGSTPEHETWAIAHIDGRYIFKGARSEHSTYADANYDGNSNYGLAAYYLLMM
ncbi:MAG: hypothetical protein HFH60_03660 [Lachnospiraceae bacterium]|nr:hypothetical protein [Lachnospiraceae bacterium]